MPWRNEKFAMHILACHQELFCTVSIAAAVVHRFRELEKSDANHVKAEVRQWIQNTDSHGSPSSQLFSLIFCASV